MVVRVHPGEPKHSRVAEWSNAGACKASLFSSVRIRSLLPNRAVGTVGSATGLHPVGREFETLTAHQITGPGLGPTLQGRAVVSNDDKRRPEAYASS